MNSLVSYGSDDNSDDSGDERFPEMPGRSTASLSKNYRKPASHEDNYEEVGMDMSEDSNDSTGPDREDPKMKQNAKPDRSSSSTLYRQSPPYGHISSANPQRRSGSRSPKYRREEDEKRNSRNEDRTRGDDRYRKRDDRSSRDSRDDRSSRDSRDDKSSRDSRDDKSSRDSRDDDKGRDKYRDDRRDKRDDRYVRDRRDRRRSRSRDRRRSRSPRRSSRSPRRASRSPRRSPRRSRSGSRDSGARPFPTRREKADKRMDRLDKLGIEFKPDNYPASALEEAERNIKNNTGDRFFMPGITGRFREQIEKRKLLWQKAKEQVNTTPSKPAPSNITAPSGSKASKVYEATAFADDKTSNKFKRLMGIKETDTSSLPVKSTDVLKKQQEMFSSMEAQYEVARTATHTMRGVGLGFGSFQR